jgi:hypothetical protein
VVVGDEDARALLGKGAGARGADPGAAPGDERDLSAQWPAAEHASPSVA